MKDACQNHLTIELPPDQKKRITYDSPKLTVEDDGYNGVQADLKPKPAPTPVPAPAPKVELPPCEDSDDAPVVAEVTIHS